MKFPTLRISRNSVETELSQQILRKRGVILGTAIRRPSFWVGVSLGTFGLIVSAKPSMNMTNLPPAFWFFLAYVALVFMACSFSAGRWILIGGAMILGAVGGAGSFMPSISRTGISIPVCHGAAIVALVGGACSFLQRFRALALSVSLLCMVGSRLIHSTDPIVCRTWPAVEREKMPDRTVGSSAPDIEADDLRGQKMTLSEYRGKVVMLVFWASWCRPCMGDVPHEKALVERFSGRPFALVGVNSDDSTAIALAAIERHSIPWRSFWNGGAGGPITDQWGILEFPTVYLIDDEGVIQHKDLRGDALDASLEQMIATAETRGSKEERKNARPDDEAPSPDAAVKVSVP